MDVFPPEGLGKIMRSCSFTDSKPSTGNSKNESAPIVFIELKIHGPV